MKKLKSLLATLAMLLCTISASAHSFEVDGIYYNITFRKTVQVTYRGSSSNSYSNEYSGDVVIPESVTYESKTYAVTSIGYCAFWGCSGLTSVTIGNGVTSIGAAAFDGCGNLTSVHISDIAAWCNIKFDDYDSNPLYYAKHLYMNGKEITELVIPDGVTSIANYAFYNCSSITSISIPNTVTSIGGGAFADCSSLTSVTIPKRVTSIGYYAFDGCSSLNSITIPNSVTSIGGEAFRGCSSLTSVTIPNSVKSIGESAFNGCSSLTSVTIPNGINQIEESTFYGCSKLKNVTLPKKLYIIKKRAFQDCSSLKSIAITDSVWYIYQEAFANCKGLESVKVLAETPPFAYDNTFSNYEIELCVPEKSVETYQKTNPWSKFKTFKNLTDIANVKALPVVVQANNGTITVSGADDGTMVEVYGISGTKLGEAKTTLNKATIHTDAQTGSIVIVKVGNKAIKIKI